MCNRTPMEESLTLWLKLRTVNNELCTVEFQLRNAFSSGAFEAQVVANSVGKCCFKQIQNLKYSFDLFERKPLVPVYWRLAFDRALVFESKR